MNAPTEPTGEHVPLAQVAGELGVPYDDAYRLVRSGRLPGTWVPKLHGWYVTRQALDTYLRQRET